MPDCSAQASPKSPRRSEPIERDKRALCRREQPVRRAELICPRHRLSLHRWVCRASSDPAGFARRFRRPIPSGRLSLFYDAEDMRLVVDVMRISFRTQYARARGVV
jgi:hypothetical protein